MCSRVQTRETIIVLSYMYGTRCTTLLHIFQFVFVSQLIRLRTWNLSLPYAIVSACVYERWWKLKLRYWFSFKWLSYWMTWIKTFLIFSFYFEAKTKMKLKAKKLKFSFCACYLMHSKQWRRRPNGVWSNWESLFPKMRVKNFKTQ